jgi:hypothetical protein
MRRLLLVSSMVLAATVLMSGPSTVLADVGAGVGAAPIVLGEPARRGGTYSLPALFVVNTGTEPGRYALQVKQLTPKGTDKEVPPDWLTFAQNGFSLPPKKGMNVALTLRIPADAKGGTYRSDLIARTVSSRPGGTAFGASAATELTFHVDPAPESRRPWSRWALAVIAAAALVVVAALTARQARRRAAARARV